MVATWKRSVWMKRKIMMSCQTWVYWQNKNTPGNWHEQPLAQGVTGGANSWVSTVSESFSVPGDWLRACWIIQLLVQLFNSTVCSLSVSSLSKDWCLDVCVGVWVCVCTFIHLEKDSACLFFFFWKNRCPGWYIQHSHKLLVLTRAALEHAECSLPFSRAKPANILCHLTEMFLKQPCL